ncbi:hypothetical protein ACFQYP_17645 [Nonomuraea antimicrobica]
MLDLNPEWDERFMDLCATGRLEDTDAWTPDSMAAAAGNSAHEVRTWLAAHSALRAATNTPTMDAPAVHYRFYRAIPEFIAGFGVMVCH